MTITDGVRHHGCIEGHGAQGGGGQGRGRRGGKVNIGQIPGRGFVCPTKTDG